MYLLSLIFSFLAQLDCWNPLVVEWVGHYISGKGGVKTLPEWVKELTEQAITYTLSTERNMESLTANVLIDDWYSGLAGVVGRFNFGIELTEEGLKYHAYDTWDFNTQCSVQLKVPFIKLGKLNWERENFPVSIYNGTVLIDEAWLASFNEKHAFETRWEGLLPWSALGCKHEEIYQAWKSGDKTNLMYPHTKGDYLWFTKDIHWGFPGTRKEWSANKECAKRKDKVDINLFALENGGWSLNHLTIKLVEGSYVFEDFFGDYTVFSVIADSVEDAVLSFWDSEGDNNGY